MTIRDHNIQLHILNMQLKPLMAKYIQTKDIYINNLHNLDSKKNSKIINEFNSLNTLILDKINQLQNLSNKISKDNIPKITQQQIIKEVKKIIKEKTKITELVDKNIESRNIKIDKSYTLNSSRTKYLFSFFSILIILFIIIRGMYTTRITYSEIILLIIIAIILIHNYAYYYLVRLMQFFTDKLNLIYNKYVY